MEARALGQLVDRERPSLGAKQFEQPLPTRVAERSVNGGFHGHGRTLTLLGLRRIREFPDRPCAQLPMLALPGSSTICRRNPEWRKQQ
jgi:hypothetical protein